MRYHSLIARRSDFGVAESRFGLCSPKAWLRMPNFQVHERSGAHVRLPPANCGCTFFPVAKHCPRSSNETASSGGPIARLFWSHPYQCPRLRGSSPCIVPPPIRRGRLWRPGSASTAAYTWRVPSRGLGSTVDCWAAERCRYRASRKGFNHTTSVE